MTMLSGFDDDIARDCPPRCRIHRSTTRSRQDRKERGEQGCSTDGRNAPTTTPQCWSTTSFQRSLRKPLLVQAPSPAGLIPPRLAANTNAPKAQHNHTASRVEGILEDLLPPKSLIEHAEERFQDHSRRPLFSTGSGSGFCSSAHLDLYAGIAAMTRGLESSISGAGPIRAKNKRLETAMLC